MEIYMQVLELVNGQVKKGLEKYGKTLGNTDLKADELIDHAVKESIDNIFYLLALKKKLKEEKQEIFDVVRCETCKFNGRGACVVFENYMDECINNGYQSWRAKPEVREKYKDLVDYIYTVKNPGGTS